MRTKMKAVSNYKNFFKDKKITALGLGLLGRGIGDVIFLAKEGADLIVTDLKTREDLADSLARIKKELGETLYKEIKFVLGEHKLENFKNRDFILKAAGVPLDSPFIAEARKNSIPIKMDASWFAELASVGAECPESNRGIKIIGVTGTRGKSTVTHLVYEILEAFLKGNPLKASQGLPLGKVYLGGNVRGLATLPLLKKVKAGDMVVMELDSWQLQGFGDSKISPHISVFTNLMVDHQNYYANNMERYFADKANIYRSQKEGEYLIAGTEIAKKIKKEKLKSQLIIPDSKIIPKSWKVKLIGEHNLLNIAYAVTVARILDIPEKTIKQAVENYTGVPGRLEFVKEIRGVKYYNDTTATTPDGVMAALRALDKFTGKIILIGGGRDKELDYKKYAPVVKKSAKSLALFMGTGTDKIVKSLGRTKFPIKIFDNMPEAFAWANAQAKKGDIVLLSPGAASFGVFKNEFDRGDQFVAQVKKLK